MCCLDGLPEEAEKFLAQETSLAFLLQQVFDTAYTIGKELGTYPDKYDPDFWERYVTTGEILI